MVFSHVKNFARSLKIRLGKKTAEGSTGEKGERHRTSSLLVDNLHHPGSDDDLSQGVTRQFPLANRSAQASNLIEPAIGDPQSQPPSHSKTLPAASQPEAKSEKSNPSRSTSGSDSTYHDNDGPKSVSYDPTMPVPLLHEEPGLMLENSRPVASPAPERISARKKYYEQDEERHRVIPKEILLYLHVIFDAKPVTGKRTWKKSFHLDWLNDASYKIVNDAAEQYLASSPDTIDKKVFRKDGICKLFEDRHEVFSKGMEHEDKWSEVLHVIIAQFVTIPEKEYAKFHLEVTWTYDVLDDTALDETMTVEKPYSKKIAEQILAKMRTNWRNKKFIPQIDFNNIITKPVIRDLVNQDESLKRIQDGEIRNGQVFSKEQFIRDIVANQHKKLLALCVYEDLPLICLWEMLYLKKVTADQPLTLSDMPPGAEKVHKINFSHVIDHQWSFKPHQFLKNDDVHCFRVEDDKVLPIEACDGHKEIGSGISKQVYKVKIQPGHHNFTADKTTTFALKAFKNSCPVEEFTHESEILRKLLDAPHNHIAPHFASWTQTDNFFMLSPLASGGNLTDYWSKNSPQLGNPDFVLWELRQLRGLADALKYLYNLGGYHHDIKGQNILAFNEGDSRRPTLKISDFGTAKISSRLTAKDESNPTKRYTQATSSYEAPDYIILGHTSRPYDVWTLGCLFLDMLVWTFASEPLAIEKFSSERRGQHKQYSDTMFWYTAYGGKTHTTNWKLSVRNMLQSLEDRCSSDKGAGLFKELVQTTSKMLRMHPERRPKAFEVHNDLERMVLWAEDARRHPSWNIQQPLVGPGPSAAKSDTSGELPGDGVPVHARLGYLMMVEAETASETTYLAPRKAKIKALREGSGLEFMGSNDMLRPSENNSQLTENKVHFTIDDIDLDSSDHVARPGDNIEMPRPLYGSDFISPDQDPFGEAQTTVASAATSEMYLPPASPLSKMIGGPVDDSARAEDGLERTYDSSP